MTKLYHHEPEGWQTPGAQSKGATRVDVPSSPAELAAWLQSRRVPPEGDAFDGLVPGNAAARELLEQLRDPQLASAAAEGGAVISAADVERVNDTRPSFLPRLSAEEIEARRMAAHQCPKCGEPRAAIRLWLARADDQEVQRIREIIAEQLEEAGR